MKKEQEQWEIDLRSKLDKEVPHGIYTIGDGTKNICHTGKYGWIEFEVALQKAVKEMFKDIK